MRKKLGALWQKQVKTLEGIYHVSVEEEFRFPQLTNAPLYTIKVYRNNILIKSYDNVPTKHLILWAQRVRETLRTENRVLTDNELEIYLLVYDDNELEHA